MMQVQSVKEAGRKHEKLHMSVVSAGTPSDEGNCMLNITLEGEIRDKSRQAHRSKTGEQRSCNT
jgi:hypothetical protein